MLRVAGIIDESIVDGEGWRYVIFFQGCKHGCKQCQNPQTWDMNGGQQIYADDLLEQIYKAFDENILLDGVTLSGGDPLYQPSSDIIYICKEMRRHGINIWTYTGFKWEQIINDIELLDMVSCMDVVVDGEFLIELKTLDKKYVGSSNQRIIDARESLKKGEIVEIT